MTTDYVAMIVLSFVLACVLLVYLLLSWVIKIIVKIMEGMKTGYMRWRLAEHTRYLRFQPDIKYKEELQEKEANLRYELSAKID